MEYLAPLSILFTFLIIVVAVLWKFESSDLLKLIEGKNLLIFLAFILFITLLIVHLFEAQSWMADTLKIVIGILVGVGSSSVVSKTQTAIGENINQAMRDIIERVDGDINELRDSIVNQHTTNNQILNELTKSEHSSPVIERKAKITIESIDSEFIKKLKRIQNEGDDWTQKWIDECIMNDEIREKIEDEFSQLQKNGWRVFQMNLDNTMNGLHINVTLIKPFNTKT